MSDQTFVKITIEADEDYNQEGVTLKIELDEETKIDELLNYLIDQNKLKIPEDKLVVEIEGKKIGLSVNIGDCASGKKAELVIRREIQQTQNIQSSILNIPTPGPIPENNFKSGMALDYPSMSNNFKPEVKQPQERKPQQRKPEERKPQVRQPQPVKEEPSAKNNNDSLQLIICVQDGTDKIEFSYFVAPEKTFDDIKEDIYKHIMKKNLVDNWTETEETKVQRGGKVFTKGAHAFSKLGVAPKTTFTLIRTFPGGSR